MLDVSDKSSGHTSDSSTLSCQLPIISNEEHINGVAKQLDNLTLKIPDATTTDFSEGLRDRLQLITELTSNEDCFGFNTALPYSSL